MILEICVLLSIAWTTVQTTTVSYNLPKFCSRALWNANATTFATENKIGKDPHSIFVDKNNNIYVPNRSSNKIVLWHNNGKTEYKTIAGNLVSPQSVFVTLSGDMYVANVQSSWITKFTLNETRSTLTINKMGNCLCVFVDVNSTIYYSFWEVHKIFKQPVSGTTVGETTAAGNGSAGKANNQLNQPFGLFVDVDLGLYVADFKNNRIQHFRSGQVNGTTVVGDEVSFSAKLNHPTGVVLDGEKNLFIVDCYNHRIVRLISSDLRCVAGCSQSSGSDLSRLNEPISLSFDSYGNIYVADKFNNRIQKFVFITNSCNLIATTSPILRNNKPSSRIPPIGTTTVVDIATTEVKRSTTTSGTTAIQSFVAPNCYNYTSTGVLCSQLESICKLASPCHNNGSCTLNSSASRGYSCSCLPYFNGTLCQYDHRPCKPNTCWNNGTCVPDKSNTTFECRCAVGWDGKHCETKINYCWNATCLNKGVCFPLFMNYKCECVGDYSGRHCEISSRRMIIHKIISKTVSYVAILVLIVTVMFFIIMDILKYCFGIDPIHEERERLRREKRMKKHKPIIQRPVYVNPPPVVIIQETTL
ncbi:unnamed protein product [Adineta ricciae]|uniref:EGF-like domain-containing protein n=2 Tax=Adineta ricciae TaxID=249248 RepID=A0A815EWL2_ADIRI|nr:unnamed protein product [Adineta ricciae]